jgi:hypothetical protein
VNFVSVAGKGDGKKWRVMSGERKAKKEGCVPSRVMTGESERGLGGLAGEDGFRIGKSLGRSNPTPGVSVRVSKKRVWSIRNLEVCTENGRR